MDEAATIVGFVMIAWGLINILGWGLLAIALGVTLLIMSS